MSVTIWHNPRCSKSRQTLQLLQDKGFEPIIIEYLQNPPNQAELELVLQKLGKSARELLRKTETIYKELGLKDLSLSDAVLLQAMLDNPKLIERPIVFANNKAALGRPPEAVLAIL